MPRPIGQVPVAYRVRIAGRLDEHWSSWFGELALTYDDTDGTTELVGVLPDQAALHGLLTKVRDLGVELISVTRGDIEPMGSPQQGTVDPPESGGTDGTVSVGSGLG
jgi:hypothetical protein